MAVADRHRHFAPRMSELLALPPRRRRPLAFTGFFADAAAPVMQPDLAAVVDEVRPDIVIHEIAELAGAAVATARGIPHVTVAFSGALPPGTDELLIERITPVWAAEGLAAPSMAEIFGTCYLHPFPPSFGQLPNGDAVRPMRAVPLGGTGGEQPAWLADLGVDRPLVYLTSGTEPAAANA
ncbi:unnamed protein product, partial [Phaeothamnion confervicola]